MTSASVTSLPLNGTIPPYYPFYQVCFGMLDWWEMSRNISSMEGVCKFKGGREWLFLSRATHLQLSIFSSEQYVFEFLFDFAGERNCLFQVYDAVEDWQTCMWPGLRMRVRNLFLSLHGQVKRQDIFYCPYTIWAKVLKSWPSYPYCMGFFNNLFWI